MSEITVLGVAIDKWLRLLVFFPLHIENRFITNRWMMWNWSYNSYIGYTPYALCALCRLYHHVSLLCWNVSQTLFPSSKYEGISSIRNLRPEPRLPFPDLYFWPLAAHCCSRDGNITQDLQGIKCLLTLCSIVTQLFYSMFFLVWDDLCSWRALLMQTELFGPVLACHVRSVRKALHFISNALCFPHDRKIIHLVTMSLAWHSLEFNRFLLHCVIQQCWHHLFIHLPNL